MNQRKPIFLDRDGVLNVDITPYVTRLDELQIFPWTVEALSALDHAGYDIYIVSNQQGVAKGLLSQETLDQVSEAIQAAVRPRGFEIKKFYYCTALRSESHTWRKPDWGMIRAAQDEFRLTLDGAFVVGDKWSDIEMGRRAGLRPLLVLTGVTAAGEWEGWKYPPERVFPTLLEAVQWIVGGG